MGVRGELRTEIDESQIRIMPPTSVGGAATLLLARKMGWKEEACGLEVRSLSVHQTMPPASRQGRVRLWRTVDGAGDTFVIRELGS